MNNFYKQGLQKERVQAAVNKADDLYGEKTWAEAYDTQNRIATWGKYGFHFISALLASWWVLSLVVSLVKGEELAEIITNDPEWFWNIGYLLLICLLIMVGFEMMKDWAVSGLFKTYYRKHWFQAVFFMLISVGAGVASFVTSVDGSKEWSDIAGHTAHADTVDLTVMELRLHEMYVKPIEDRMTEYNNRLKVKDEWNTRENLKLLEKELVKEKARIEKKLASSAMSNRKTVSVNSVRGFFTAERIMWVSIAAELMIILLTWYNKRHFRMIHLESLGGGQQPLKTKPGRTGKATRKKGFKTGSFLRSMNPFTGMGITNAYQGSNIGFKTGSGKGSFPGVQKGSKTASKNGPQMNPQKEPQKNGLIGFNQKGSKKTTQVGYKAKQKKTEKTLDKLRKKYTQMGSPTQAELARAAKVSRSTVKRYWKDIKK